MQRRILATGVVLAAMAVAACQAGQPFAGTRMGLGAVLPDSQAPSSLTIQLDKDTLARFTGRTLQSTVADIQYVTVTVSPTGFPDQSKTLQKSQLAGGLGSVTFTNLPAVATTVHISAFDAGSKVIGAGTQNVTVAAGTPTTVNFAIPLNPTYITSTGSINGSISFQDGPTIVGTPPPAAVVKTGTQLQKLSVDTPVAMGFDKVGNAWVLEYTHDKIARFGPGGTPIDTLADPPVAPAAASLPTAIAFDPLGNAWVANYQGGTVSSFSAAGKLLATVPIGLYPSALAFDPTGILWVAAYYGNSVVKLNVATGKPAGVIQAPTNPISIAFDASGTGYVLGMKTQDVTKVSATGTAASKIKVGASPQAMVFDGLGNLWVSNSSDATLSKIGPLGAVVGTYKTGRTPKGLAVDHAGNIWVACGLDNEVQKFTSSGVLVGSYHTGTNPTSVTVDAGGSIWVTNLGDGTVVALAP